MAFFRDLFSRGPKLPDPVHDPFHGDEEARREVGKLQRGDWRGAAALLARTRNGDERAALAGHIAGTAEGWPAWIDQWHAAEKDRAEPWLVRGAIRIGWAWAARGSGRASDVGEDAWSVFFERLGEAEEDLAEAIRLDEEDATAWAYLLITGRGLDADVDELMARFEAARTRDPQGWLAPMMTLEALTEKWCGSHDIMFAFAHDVSGDAPEGSPLHALVAEAHLERWLYFSMEDPPDGKGQTGYYERREVQEDLRRAWERGPGAAAFLPGRFATSQQALFAFGFSLGDDHARARAVFERMGNKMTLSPWSHLGDPVEMFTRARALAYE